MGHLGPALCFSGLGPIQIDWDTLPFHLKVIKLITLAEFLWPWEDNTCAGVGIRMHSSSLLFCLPCVVWVQYT